jgi:hypothetical protein
LELLGHDRHDSGGESEQRLTTGESSVSTNPNTYKRLTWALGALSIVLIVLLARSQSQLHTLRSDVRYARDVIRTFQNRRAAALSGDPTQAEYVLETLRTPPGSEPFHGALAGLVEYERQAAIRDINAYVRAKTGKQSRDDSRQGDTSPEPQK